MMKYAEGEPESKEGEIKRGKRMLGRKTGKRKKMNSRSCWKAAKEGKDMLLLTVLESTAKLNRMRNERVQRCTVLAVSYISKHIQDMKSPASSGFHLNIQEAKNQIQLLEERRRGLHPRPASLGQRVIVASGPNGALQGSNLLQWREYLFHSCYAADLLEPQHEGNVTH